MGECTEKANGGNESKRARHKNQPVPLKNTLKITGIAQAFRADENDSLKTGVSEKSLTTKRIRFRTSNNFGSVTGVVVAEARESRSVFR